MYYGKIESCSIAAGPGCRVSLFVSGCTNCCKGCFQPETWDFKYGKEFTEETVERILELAKPTYISGFSLMGGDPMHPNNRQAVIELIKKFKSKYPNKTVWLWTGYLFEEVKSDLVDSGIDVIVDGRFVEDLKDLRLKYCGSSNQRVILVKESIETGTITLYK